MSKKFFTFFYLILLLPFVIFAQKQQLYINNDYGFCLFQNPFKDEKIHNFSVYTIEWESKNCPFADTLPDFENPDGLSLSQIQSKRVIVGKKHIKACYLENYEGGAAGSVYVAYYYIFREKNNRLLILKFTLRFTNCGMTTSKRKCREENHRKIKRLKQYMKSFYFI